MGNSVLSILNRFILLINEFGCYDAKFERVKKAGSHKESNPGHLWLESPVLYYWAMTAGQPPTLTILYMYCTGGTECLTRTPGSRSVCALRTQFGINRKILSVRKEPMLSGFLTLNAKSILLKKWIWMLWGEIEESEKDRQLLGV